MLDFRIETFLCVCKWMNFTKASQELNITQPAVSQHIKHIEAYYKVKLFTYKNKKLTLTGQGAYLKRAFEALHHDALRVKDDIAHIDKPRLLRIGATLSIGEYYIPPLLETFLKRHLDINLSVVVADTKVLLEKLDNGQIDFAFCEGYFNKLHYAYQFIKEEKVCALCAADYDVSSVGGLASLFGHRILMREKGSGTREVFERYLKEHGFSLNCFPSCCDFTSPHLIIKMLLAGQGISFLYRTVAEKWLERGDLKEIEIPGFHLCHEFNAIWKKGSLYQEYYKDMINEFIK